MQFSKTLVLENKTAEDVSQAMIESGRQKEPFHIFEMDLAYKRIKHFKEIMPRIKIFYAMKANDSDMMLKLAASCGLGYDCASPGEIHKILKLNVSPLSIIFAVPTKTPEWMSYARQCGIKYTTFDSSYELHKIKQYWPEARLLIRIRVDGNSIYNLGKKFGCDFETEAVDLLEEAAALNIKVAGVAYHVGSVCSSADSYVLGLQQAKFLFEHEAKAGRKMNIVDIGGGFISDRTNRIDEVPIGDAIVNMLYLNEGVYGTLRYNEPWHTVKRYEGAYSFTTLSTFSSLEGPRTRTIISEELYNKIKNSKAFDQDDFVTQDISEPLPSSLPPVMVRTRFLDGNCTLNI